jgi:hypothetical protein
MKRATRRKVTDGDVAENRYSMEDSLNSKAPLLTVVELAHEFLVAKDTTEIQNWLLDESTSWTDLTCPLTKQIPQPLESAIKETKARLLAPLSYVLQSTQNLPSQPPPNSKDRMVWRERCFLKAFALNRTGAKEDSAAWFDLARSSPMAEGGHREASHLSATLERIELENLVNALNADKHRLVYQETAKLLKSITLDVLSLVRTLAIRSIAAGEAGDLDTQERCLEAESGLLLRLSMPSLFLTWKRRRALAYLTQEQFSKAASLIEEGIAETTHLSAVH